MRPLVRVVSSAESAARDASAIAAGVPSRALMQRAGAAAASEIARRVGDRLARGAIVCAGPGNNGGDAWVVARAFAATGVAVHVVEPVAARTDDARAERDLADGISSGTEMVHRGEGVIVDGLLGTGASGAPRGPIGNAVRAINEARDRGAFVAALDLPTGVDASTGASDGAVLAHLTLSFGTLKRGHSIARGACGAIVVLDIGLGKHAELDDGAPCAVDEPWVAQRIPRVAADAHKGTRKKLAVIGGAAGMAGAAILAARSALRSGVGMVKLVVAEESMAPVQEAEPLALAAAWPPDDVSVEDAVARWADALVIGPGLGRAPEARTLLERVLRVFSGPVVLDADALNAFAGDLPKLRELLRGRRALLTPHSAELARLANVTVDQVLERRFEIGGEIAAEIDAVVLLKGVPTVISDAGGSRLVSAAGSPVLATAGSGDVLSGIAGTLMAQMDRPLEAAAVAAWIHGRASELVAEASSSHVRVRGLTLDDVLHALPRAWRVRSVPTRSPVLLELPSVGELF